jgi:hypothetical protein
MQDSRIEQLKDFIKKFCEHNPKLRRFPKSFWADVVAISDNYTIKDLAGRIVISEGPLTCPGRSYRRITTGNLLSAKGDSYEYDEKKGRLRPLPRKNPRSEQSLQDGPMVQNQDDGSDVEEKGTQPERPG